MKEVKNIKKKFLGKGYTPPLPTLILDESEYKGDDYDDIQRTYSQNRERYQTSCTLENAIKKQSKLKTGDGSFLFFDGKRWGYINNNTLYDLYHSGSALDYSTKHSDRIGIIIKIKNKNVILIDADEDTVPYHLLEYIEKQNITHAMFSFECFLQLAMVGKSQNKTSVYNAFGENSDFAILDFIGEDFIELTAQQKRLHQEKKEIKAPAGYRLVGDKFHKSPTVLIFDSKAKKTYLLGQDENQYFGCELADNPKTIEKAFVSLKPIEARIANCPRQGEWFLLHVEKDDLPAVEDRLLELNNIYHLVQFGEKKLEIGTDVSLGRDHELSNKHNINARSMFVAKNGSIYALDPSLEHREHEAVQMSGWVRFMKNTAVRSVSVDGVD